MEEVGEAIKLLPSLAMIIGAGIAIWWYFLGRVDIPARLARDHGILYRFLLNKWYFDEIYDFLIVRPTIRLGRLLWRGGDGWLIDGFGPDGVSARVIDVTRYAMRLQTGYLYHYAFAMLIGAALFITWFILPSGGH
jgi:NADH-quinone oxidoreductase subunit L